MNYKTFINLPEKIINRDKKFFDHLNKIQNEMDLIMSEIISSSKDIEAARIKWNVISEIKFTFIELTNNNLNQEPNR